MTPADTLHLVEAWNEAQQSQSADVPPMTWDRLQELKRQYPDG